MQTGQRTMRLNNTKPLLVMVIYSEIENVDRSMVHSRTVLHPSVPSRLSCLRDAVPSLLLALSAGAVETPDARREGDIGELSKGRDGLGGGGGALLGVPVPTFW